MKNILITRERDQFEKVKELFLSKGLNPIPFPVIKFTEEEFSFEEDNFDYLIFTSTNGVKFFFRKYTLKKAKIVAVGEKTKRAIESLGYRDILVPEDYSSEGLLRYITDRRCMFEGKRFGLVRAVEGINTLLDKRPDWLNIKLITVYRTELNIPENLDAVQRMLRDGQIDIVVFSSPSSVEGFLKLIPQQSILENLKIAVIGKTTQQKVEEKGLKVKIKPEKPMFESLIEDIIKYT